MNKNPHKLTKIELLKRSGDRRRMALRALVSAAGQHRANPDVEASLTPVELACAWRLHPSSAFRVLERLREHGAVARTGVGLNAEYQITATGVKRLAYLDEIEAARAQVRRNRGERE